MKDSLKTNRTNYLFFDVQDITDFLEDTGWTQKQLGIKLAFVMGRDADFSESYINKVKRGVKGFPVTEEIRAGLIDLQKESKRTQIFKFRPSLPVVAVRGRYAGIVGKWNEETKRVDEVTHTLVNMGEKINGIPVVLAAPVRDVLEVK